MFPVIVRPVEEAVDSVVCPVTASVPVAVIFVPVAFPKRNEVIDPVKPLRRVEKNEVEVAAVRVVVAKEDVPVTVTNFAVRELVALTFPITEFVPVELVNTSLVIVAFVLTKLVKNAVVALIKLEKKLVVVAEVIVALVPYKAVAVNPVADAFASTV